MLDAIRAAKTEILLETYIWTDDATGRKFVEALECAPGWAAGPRDHRWIWFARALRDDPTAHARRRHLLAVFHPVRPWRRRWAWPVRDHRKLLVVDGSVAFTGGLNIGDDYAPAAWGGRGWHDVHCRLTGPAVANLRWQFFASWSHAIGERGEPLPWQRFHDLRRVPTWHACRCLASAGCETVGAFAVTTNSRSDRLSTRCGSWLATHPRP